MSSIAAAAVAVGAAALLGSAGVAQRHAALTVPLHDAGDPRLLVALTRRVWWWAGTAASVAGLGLQVLALTLGPIIVVQSVMISSIVFTTVAEWLLTRRRPSRYAWTGMALTGTGLVGLLATLAPTTGSGAVPSGGSTLLVGAACLAVMLAAVAWSRRPASGGPDLRRDLAPAVATGLGYGMTAVQLKTVGAQLAAGLTVPFGHPALYVAAVLGPLAILLSQAALQHSTMATTVVSLILVVDPLVGLAAGLLWFGEGIDVSALATAAAYAVMLLAGIAVTQAGGRPGHYPPPTVEDHAGAPRPTPTPPEHHSLYREPGNDHGARLAS